MKILHNAEYHAQRDTSAIPNRRPSTPTGSLKLVGQQRVKDNVAFFHSDGNGVVWQSYAGRNFRQQHIFYSANVDTFMATVFNAGWYSVGAFRWSPLYKSLWLEYVAKRSKVTASGYTNF